MREAVNVSALTSQIILKLPGDPQSSSTKVAPVGVGGLIGSPDVGVVVDGGLVVVVGGLVVGGALEGGGA